jgi:hypothetical protein
MVLTAKKPPNAVTKKVYTFSGKKATVYTWDTAIRNSKLPVTKRDDPKSERLLAAKAA